MIVALTTLWDMILKGNVLDKLGKFIAFFIEVFTGIHTSTDKYAPAVNGVVLLTEKLAEYKKTLEFSDLYDLRRKMFEYMKTLTQTKDREDNMIMVRDWIVANEVSVGADVFEAFIGEVKIGDLEVKGLYKWTFASKLIKSYVEHNKDTLEEHIMNFMIETAVARFFKK